MVTAFSAETQGWPTLSPPGVLEGNDRNDHPRSLRTPIGSQSRSAEVFPYPHTVEASRAWAAGDSSLACRSRVRQVLIPTRFC